MGQITNPIVKGITVNPIDRESGPGAGAGATGNNDLYLGLNAGKNSALSNSIIIGTGTGAGGITDTANLNGSTIIGVGSAPTLISGAAAAGGLPLTLYGSNNLVGFPNVNTGIGGTVIVGTNILNSTQFGNNAHIAGCVFIGNSIFPTAGLFTPAGSNNATVIGYRIGIGSTPVDTVVQSLVMIGSNLFLTTHNNPYSGVVIGTDIDCTASLGSAFGPNVIIGSTMNIPGGATADVIIGGGQYQGGGALQVQDNVLIGFAVNYNGSNNVAIGFNALVPFPAGVAGSSNVIIGSFAGTTVPTTAGFNNLLVIEAGPNAGAVKTLVYGQFLTGNTILGNSVNGTNRDVGGTTTTNILKLLNGTVGNAAPVGGGYFYVSAGALHWVDSGNNDTQLSPSASGQLASSVVNYTNNAAAAAGTLNNAPVAGNPTKWIPINDNGTIRNIPAW